MAAAAAAPSSRRGECYAVIDLKKTAAMSNLQKALPRDDGTSRKTRHNSTDLPLWEGKKRDTGMPGIKMRENVQEREKMRENVWWYFPPTIIVKPLFSHFLHSYQLLLDEIVTLLSQALSILFIFFFSHFAWEGWEMIVNYLSPWFLVAVWPLGQRIGFRKKYTWFRKLSAVFLSF